MKKGVSVVIPNYNGLHLLKTCIPALEKALINVDNYEIIITDDASTDGSEEFVKENFPDVEFISSPANQGFSKNINRGIRKAQFSRTFTLNTDLLVPKDFFVKVLQVFENKSVFGVMTKIVDEDTGKDLEGRKLGQIEKDEISIHDDFPADFDQYPSFYVCGGNGVFDTEKLQSLGGFSEIYSPFYYEDADLGLRAQKKGWECIYLPHVSCRHKASSTIKKYHDRDYVRTIAKRNFLVLNYALLDDNLFENFKNKLEKKMLLYNLMGYLGFKNFTVKAYQQFKADLDEIKAYKNSVNSHANLNFTQILDRR